MRSTKTFLPLSTCSTLTLLVYLVCAHAEDINSIDPFLLDMSVVKSNTDFSWSLFSKLAAGAKDENVFFSPYSISTALTMTMLGAKGNTHTQMKDVLKFKDLADVDLHNSFEALHSTINTPGAEYALKTANRIFARQNYKFLDSFMKETHQHYKAEAVTLDFQGDTEGSRKHINDWVESQTANKIKDLMPQGSIDPLTAMVLVNAIYFKGNWDHKFNPAVTKKEKFQVTGNEFVDVDMMHMKRDLKYARNDELDCQILELPYVKRDLSMYIYLPNQKDGISALESKLNSSHIENFSNALFECEVAVSLPRFKIEQSFDIGDTLSAMGMGDMFTAKVADFSGMDGTRELYVSKVVHKAFVEVNEEGTEAAAATGVTMMLMSMPMVHTFKVDHPFIFLIRENRTGSVLFLGRVARP